MHVHTRCECMRVVDMQDILLMVGPYGDWIKHDLEDKTVLVSECDGVRLISAEKHEFLSRVPDSLVDVFKIGSTAPGDSQQLSCAGPATILVAWQWVLSF